MSFLVFFSSHKSKLFKRVSSSIFRYLSNPLKRNHLILLICYKTCSIVNEWLELVATLLPQNFSYQKNQLFASKFFLPEKMATKKLFKNLLISLGLLSIATEIVLYILVYNLFEFIMNHAFFTKSFTKFTISWLLHLGKVIGI